MLRGNKLPAVKKIFILFYSNKLNKELIHMKNILGRNVQKTMVLFFIVLLTFLNNGWSANIVRPWRSTTAIVKAGESFEVWFNADNGQTVNSVQLVGPYNKVDCTNSITTGNWEYDPLSGNRYNTEILVTVPLIAPADRYDLVLHTTDGTITSYGGVKVVNEFKAAYYIMHISDGHIYQNGYDPITLLARKTAMIDIANIMDCQIIIETGDNMYNVRNHPEREEIYFLGNEALGIKGMANATAATFLVPGDHDAHTANDWPQATVEVNSDFFNDYWGMQSSNFKYGNGRFMMLNNAWKVSETSAGDHKYQVDEAIAWLSGDGSGGNFFLSAGHCYNKMHEFIDEVQQLDLVLAGDKHHIRTDNPYSFDDGSPAIAYIAGAIRDHFEFNLFRVNNETGTYLPVPGTNAVAEVLHSGSQDEIATWITNLSIEFENDNNGLFYENTATIDNKFNFPILDARVRFVMPGGFEYRVTNAEITQQFDGDEYRIIDVSLDVAANATSMIHIGDADLCPDDPLKTEPGLCGCGIEEGTCETSALIVNNGTGDGDYYPCETVTVTADDPPEHEEFDSWVIVSGNPVIYNVNDPSTLLVLEGTPAEITATYKEIIYINDASFLSQVIPPIVPGGNTTVNVTMKNTGTTTWTKANGYTLGSRNPADNTTWGFAHVALDDTDSILPEAEKKFTFEITAPQTGDLYDFQWQMTQADSGGFGAYSQNQVIKPTNSEIYLDACDVSTNWKSAGTLTLNNTDNRQGSNCLNFSGGGTDEFKKVFSTPYNARGSEEGTMLQFWYYVSDVSKFQGSNQVELGSAGKNDQDEYNWSLTGLANGWNYIRLPIREAGKSGTPHLSAINWFRLYRQKSATITTRIDAIQLIGDGVITEVWLTVKNGKGSGLYAPGDRFSIQANDAPSGKVFDSWIINSGSAQLEHPDSVFTFLTMQDTDVEITATYVADPTLSINNLQEEPGLQIYPNPVRDELQLDFFLKKPSGANISILDLTGRTIMHHPIMEKLSAGNHRYTMNIEKLTPGSYFVKACFDDATKCKLVIFE
jgi:hypothetical protein